jgi:hypothetical protein
LSSALGGFMPKKLHRETLVEHIFRGSNGSQNAAFRSAHPFTRAASQAQSSLEPNGTATPDRLVAAWDYHR